MSTFQVNEQIHVSTRAGGHNFEEGEHTATTLAEEHALHLAVKTGHASVVGRVEPPAVAKPDDEGSSDEVADEAEDASSDAGSIASSWRPTDPNPIEEEG